MTLTILDRELYAAEITARVEGHDELTVQGKVHGEPRGLCEELSRCCPRIVARSPLPGPVLLNRDVLHDGVGDDEVLAGRYKS